MKQLLVTGPRQASLCDVPCPACGVEEVLVEARLTAISTGTELRVFRAIAVDEEGRFLHETVPFQLPAASGTRPVLSCPVRLFSNVPPYSINASRSAADSRGM